MLINLYVKRSSEIYFVVDILYLIYYIASESSEESSDEDNNQCLLGKQTLLLHSL